MKHTIAMFVDQLISDYPPRLSHPYEVHVDHIDKSDQFKFAKKLIEQDGKDLFSLYENADYEEIINTLFVLLDKNNVENQVAFSEKAIEKIVDYYKPKMQKIIDDVLSNKEVYRHVSAGHKSFTHKDNGETAWSYL